MTVNQRYENARPILLVLVFVTVLYLLTVSNAPPRSDEGTYLLLARSLANGHGYREFPLSEDPHIKYPCLYPLLAAPFQRFFPEQFFLLGIMNALITIAVAYGVFVFMRGYFSPRPAAVLTLIISSNAYTFVQHAHRLMSEALFVLSAISAVLFVEDLVRRRSRLSLFGSIGAITAACYTRQIGAVLIIAAVAYLIYRKDLKNALLVGSLTTLLIIPWWTYVFITVYIRHIHPSFINVPTLGRLERFIPALGAHCSAWAHWVVFPTFFSYFRFVRGESLDGPTLLGAIKQCITGFIIVPTILGFCIHIRKERRFYDFFVLLYGIAILFAGHIYAYRLLYPIVPFLFYYLIVGSGRLIETIAGFFRDRSGTFRRDLAGMARILCAGIVFCSAMIQDVHQIYWERSGRFTRPWNAYFSAARWVKEHVPRECVVMCFKANNFYIASQRIAVTFPFSYAEKPGFRELMNAIRRHRAEYLVVTIPNFTQADQYPEDHIFRILEDNPGNFSLQQTITRYGAEARIYRVKSFR